MGSERQFVNNSKWRIFQAPTSSFSVPSGLDNHVSASLIEHNRYFRSSRDKCEMRGDTITFKMAAACYMQFHFEG
jgi:hypothetical protein